MFNGVLIYLKKQRFVHLGGISSITSIRGSRSVPVYFASKAYQKVSLEVYMSKQNQSNRRAFLSQKLAPVL
jgi:hypothetical protein